MSFHDKYDLVAIDTHYVPQIGDIILPINSQYHSLKSLKSLTNAFYNFIYYKIKYVYNDFGYLCGCMPYILNADNQFTASHSSIPIYNTKSEWFIGNFLIIPRANFNKFGYEFALDFIN